MKDTLILGLGNPILSDDAIGVRVAQELKRILGPKSNLDIESTSLGGINLLDLIKGYQKLILIDSIKTVEGVPGQVHELDITDLEESLHLAGLHDINFASTIELGRRLGYELPRKIQILAVEIIDNTTFSEKMTSELEEALPEIVSTVLKKIGGQYNA